MKCQALMLTSTGSVTLYGDGSAYPWINYYFDSVAWGDDFNHNGLIDERENDNQDDLPYERDSKGGHYFFKVRPRGSIDIYSRSL